MFSLWVGVCCVSVVAASFENLSSSNSVREDVKGSDTKTSDGSATDIMKKVISRTCSHQYTMTCFKLDMVELVELLSESKRYQLLPGVTVVKENITGDANSKTFPEALIRSMARDFPNAEESLLDEFLVKRVNDYLSSHSVSLQLLDGQSERKKGGIGEDILHSFVNGRGVGDGGLKNGGGTMMTGLMMMKGTMMTIAFGALAALAGKALMTGLLSLMLSAIVGLKSATEGGSKQTTYEIISKPHYSHSHSHSSEVQHGHGHDDHAYGRNLGTKKQSASSHGGGGGAKETQSFSVEYIDPNSEEAAKYLGSEKYQDSGEYGGDNVEYKTISEDDLKNALHQGYYDVSNLNYAALSGGAHSHDQDSGYRQRKSLDGGFIPSVVAAVKDTPLL